MFIKYLKQNIKTTCLSLNISGLTSKNGLVETNIQTTILNYQHALFENQYLCIDLCTATVVPGDVIFSIVSYLLKR